MPDRVTHTHWLQLSEFVAETMGLHFPPDRLADLQRGVAQAARELGFADAAACVSGLLSAPPARAQLLVLASHLTIGETYFFRDRKTFDILAHSILPQLIGCRRRTGERRLRVWSAACSTGEEPYSLAILLRQLLPDWQDWHLTIVATDINGRFLHKAAAGTYGEWSFRDVPPGFKERYFKRSDDGRYAILPEIKKLVRFAHLNLVEDAYPSLATDTNAMDVIFCRNALMYFTPAQVRKVIGNLHHALAEGGWLVVSPSEASHALFPQFVTVNFPGVILFQKRDAKAGAEPGSRPPGETAGFAMPRFETCLPWAPQSPVARPTQPLSARPLDEPTPAPALPTPQAIAESLYQQGRYAAAVDTLLAAFAERAPEAPALSLLVRALANRGQLAEALAWCDRWIAADKLDSAGHYLRAVVLLEQGDPEQARFALQRAVYLHPGFVLAHFALGNLARSRGKIAAADKHFANALQLLRGYRPDDPLPESDGLTAGRLTETITAMTATRSAP